MDSFQHQVASWPAQIASSQKVRDVQISPDGSLVLYQVQPFYRAGSRALSELWLAQTDVPSSAKPLTDGTFNDRAGVFHPDGRRIVFLSDRRGPGKAAIPFILELDGHQNKEVPLPVPVCTNFGRKGVEAFKISPNGEFIAFTSVDEPNSDKASTSQSEEAESDARVMGGPEAPGELSRLRLYSFSTGDIVTLEGVWRDRHVEAFCWSPDSTRLLFRLRHGRGGDYAEREVLLKCISVDDPTQTPQYLGTYPRSPYGQNICTSAGRVVSLQSYIPENIIDARALFSHTEAAFEPRRFYGTDEDAIRIVDAGTHPTAGTAVAVEVCSHVDTHIDIVFLDEPSRKPITIFRTQDEAIWFNAWDAKMVLDAEGQVSYVVAAVLSSSIRHEPPNVWAGRVGVDAREKGSRIQLSKHLQWLKDAPSFATEVMRWRADDGTWLDGLVRFPPGYRREDGPRPTILFIHGGPYRRDIPDYMPYFSNWREMLAVAGYIVISPNYRGSQGRGHKFAHAVSEGVGVYDWKDCESMVDEVVRRGLADPARLGVAGWSYGGSLAAWGTTKTKTLFKAAVVGAGVTNWEGLLMDTESLHLDAQLAGPCAPWDSEQSGMKTSPVHCVTDVTTAVLILHGEKDVRVPVSQAIGFWRGLKRQASGVAKEAAQLVLYPREPHG
ncbi:hypothetical protein C0991_009533 [Blastosporella zonata]|nr:hypothetical protein C0991_009533 [Blastosporella zonata]